MVGGLGDDTYYVDNALDAVVELGVEGVDLVQSSVDYTLSAQVENLVLLDFSKPEKGLVDGKNVLVYGYPKRNELDYLQGDAVENYLGTCALTSIANLLTQTGRPTTETQVVTLAINNSWAVTNPTLPGYQLGGSNVQDQRNLLEAYDIRNDVITGYNEQGMANMLRSGRGVILAVNAGALWADSAYRGNGSVNHAVTLTGAVFDAQSQALVGFYMADSGRGKVSDMTRFVDIATFRQAANVASAYAIYTVEPVKYWQEDINGTGNAQANSLVGNRGDNVLMGLGGNDSLAGGDGEDMLIGGAGNDTLEGGLGGDTYVFGRGAGQDLIREKNAQVEQVGQVDRLRFEAGVSADQLWFKREGNHLDISVVGTSDRVSIQDWYLGAENRVERIETSDGKYLVDIQVNALVQAMAAFSPPAIGQLSLSSSQSQVLTPLIAANWQ